MSTNAISYVDAIRAGFPTVMITYSGDPFVYDNIEWTGGDAIPSQDDLDTYIVSHQQNTLTKYQFRQLFTLTERVTCDNFGSNPNVPAQYKAILVTMFKDLEVSAEVQLSNPNTAAGVALLEQLGLIGHGRAAQIMAGSPPPA
jgi:hypothetical protein